MMQDYMVLALAYSLDLIIGDPSYLPHPVRVIGSAIQKTEGFLRSLLRINTYGMQRLREKTAGMLLAIITAGSVYITMFMAEKWFLALAGSEYTALKIIGIAAPVCLVSTTLATKELIDFVQKIIEPMKSGDITGARERLSHIVGRDTNRLDESGVLKASIESLAENASDGIIAPLFYFAIGGLPLAMAYKAINTLDSMVGYRNKRYRYFGWAAARLDDIANYMPARITGLLIVVSSFIVYRSPSTVHRSLKIMLRDGGKHPSPNSGIPEAAMAGALNITLGGPSTYNGIRIDKPFIGDGTADDYLSSSEKGIDIIRAVSLLGFSIAAGLLFVRSIR